MANRLRLWIEGILLTVSVSAVLIVSSILASEFIKHHTAFVMDFIGFIGLTVVVITSAVCWLHYTQLLLHSYFNRKQKRKEQELFDDIPF